jgi:hypothetical protein
MAALPLYHYVVFGAGRAPEVHMLDERTAKILSDRERIAGRDKALVATFGIGAEAALPAWSQECMEKIALEYKGPFARELCSICAAIALGKPYSRDRNNPQGGDRVESKRPKPTPRGPAGARAKADAIIEKRIYNA